MYCGGMTGGMYGGMGEGGIAITGGGLTYFSFLAFALGFCLLSFFYFSSSLLTAFTMSAIRAF
jgi:hypothetical protein